MPDPARKRDARPGRPAPSAPKPTAPSTWPCAPRDEQTGFSVGYVEQLYSFGDEGRQGLSSLPSDPQDQRRVISIGYLALTSDAGFQTDLNAQWRPLKAFFLGKTGAMVNPKALSHTLRSALTDWCNAAPTGEQATRRARVETLFPDSFDHWNEERVLDRYELLYRRRSGGRSAQKPDQQRRGNGLGITGASSPPACRAFAAS